MSLRVVRLPLLAAIVAVVCGALVLAPLAAGGSPIDDKRAEAQRLQAQIDANGAQADALAEQYHGAQYRMQQIDAEIARSEGGLRDAQARYDGVRHRVDARAAELYMSADRGNPVGSVDVGSVEDFAARSAYASAVNGRDDSLLSDLVAAKDDLRSRRDDLRRDRTRAQDERDRIARTRTELAAATARETALLAKTKTDLGKLVAQYRQQAAAAARAVAVRAAAEAAGRRAAAAHAAAERAHGSGTSRVAPAPDRSRGSGPPAPPPPFDPPPPPPPTVSVPPASSAAMIAVNFALAQVGKPYVFDAAGPGAYDCSGLTMAAWAAAGVSMPHYSGAQYEMFPHVPVADAQPGDLLFRGPGGSQHVEIYLGNGMVVTAPHTGDFVKVAPMGNVLPMAARP